MRIEELSILSITCSLAAAWADRKAGLVAESGQSSRVHLYRNSKNKEKLQCTPVRRQLEQTRVTVYTCNSWNNKKRLLFTPVQ